MFKPLTKVTGKVQVQPDLNTLFLPPQSQTLVLSI